MFVKKRDNVHYHSYSYLAFVYAYLGFLPVGEIELSVFVEFVSPIALYFPYSGTV